MLRKMFLTLIFCAISNVHAEVEEKLRYEFVSGYNWSSFTYGLGERLDENGRPLGGGVVVLNTGYLNYTDKKSVLNEYDLGDTLPLRRGNSLSVFGIRQGISYKTGAEQPVKFNWHFIKEGYGVYMLLNYAPKNTPAHLYGEVEVPNSDGFIFEDMVSWGGHPLVTIAKGSEKRYLFFGAVHLQELELDCDKVELLDAMWGVINVVCYKNKVLSLIRFPLVKEGTSPIASVLKNRFKVPFIPPKPARWWERQKPGVIYKPEVLVSTFPKRITKSTAQKDIYTFGPDESPVFYNYHLESELRSLHNWFETKSDFFFFLSNTGKIHAFNYSYDRQVPTSLEVEPVQTKDLGFSPIKRAIYVPGIRGGFVYTTESGKALFQQEYDIHNEVLPDAKLIEFPNTFRTFNKGRFGTIHGDDFSYMDNKYAGEGPYIKKSWKR